MNAKPENRPFPSFMRGVNTSHYISQIGNKEFADSNYFNESDIRWIAEQGYDHIRLPVDGPLLFDEKGNIRFNRLEAVDEVLQWAKRHRIAVILDMHRLPGSNFSIKPDNRLFTSEELQRQAEGLWRVIAERYKSVGPELRFEILNEPVADDPADLTRFYGRILNVIREVSPERVVLMCSNKWGSFHTVKYLEPLLDDPYVVVAVHYYEPHVFTHQGASWVKLDHHKLPPIEFPGTVPDMTRYVGKDHYAYTMGGTKLTVEAIEREFAELVEWATARGVELHLGEFGAYEAADTDSRQNWYRTVLAQCEMYGIGWAVWDYKGGFGVRERRSGKPSLVQETIKDVVSGP